MSRGFFLGAASGCLIGVIALAVVSQSAKIPSPEIGADAAGPVSVPPAVAANAVPEDKSAVVEPMLAPVPDQKPIAVPSEALTPQVKAPVKPTEETPADAISNVEVAVPSPEINPVPETNPVTEQIATATPPVDSSVAPAPNDQSAAAPSPQITVEAPLPAAPPGDAPQVAAADTGSPAPETVVPGLPVVPQSESIIAPPQTPPAAPAPVEQEVAAAVPTERKPPGFAGQVDGVRTGRLPSIGTSDTTPAPSESVSDTPDLPAVKKFAREFDNPAGKPVFAILLQDDGGPDIDRQALAELPFPVSFVIDPNKPDAEESAKIYRAAGLEVVMLVSGLPEGASATDVEVTLEANARILPEAVAVLDVETGGYQGNRLLATQVIGAVNAQGRGSLSWDRGLNAASQIARRDGLENGVIFRRIDAEDEPSTTIRRYLDRAAFKAAQDGRVIVAGTTRPETIKALLEWALEGRATTVALAPVTAAMTSQ